MNLPALGSLTGGGGLQNSNSAGGNDKIDGGGNISFGVLPPLPVLPQMGSTSTLSVSGSASNNTVMILGVTVGTVVLGTLLMRGKF